MLTIKQTFRPADYTDFEKLQCNRLANSSYKHIAFPLGCSSSEFKINFDEREISLLNNKGLVIGFARIKSVMFTHIYLDFFCLKDLKSCSYALINLQEHLIKSYDTNKFFVQLFDHEKLEQECLENNDFKLEASLSEHIWLNGNYIDVYIYGSSLYV